MADIQVSRIIMVDPRRVSGSRDLKECGEGKSLPLDRPDL